MLCSDRIQKLARLPKVRIMECQLPVVSQIIRTKSYEVRWRGLDVPAIYIRDIGEVRVQDEIHEESKTIGHPDPGTQTLISNGINCWIVTDLTLYVVWPTLAYKELFHIKYEDEHCSTQLDVLKPVIDLDHIGLVVIDTKESNDSKDHATSSYIDLNTISQRVVPTTLKTDIVNKDAEDTDE